MNLNRENTLDNENINDVIDEHIKLLNEMSSCVSVKSPYQLLKKLKREKIKEGRYKDKCSLFEAANRIMTDLIISYGIKDLLDGNDFDFDKYIVEFGNDNKNPHDIMVEKDGKILLIGEAFNVAKSFFKVKKNKSLRKLRESTAENISNDTIKILLYNSDAVSDNYEPISKENEYHIKVDLDEKMSEK